MRRIIVPILVWLVMGLLGVVLVDLVIEGCTAARADSYIFGRADVHDGDTLRVGRDRIRLWGVDAPELTERGGQAARDQLRLIVGRDIVRCVDTGRRSYNRIVAVCATDTFPDIGRELISRGNALDCPRYSRGRYHNDETTEARLALPAKPYCQ